MERVVVVDREVMEKILRELQDLKRELLELKQKGQASQDPQGD